MTNALASCFRLEVHMVARAFSRAWANTGKRMAARMAMMAITTRSSISVNAERRGVRLIVLSFLSWHASGITAGTRASRCYRELLRRRCSGSSWLAFPSEEEAATGPSGVATEAHFCYGLKAQKE